MANAQTAKTDWLAPLWLCEVRAGRPARAGEPVELLHGKVETMQLGILSDTHDNLTNLRAALELFRGNQVSTLIHCGDLTSPTTAEALVGFRVIYVEGNMDRQARRVSARLIELNPESFAGLTFEGEISGARIAVTHGHHQEEIDRLLESGAYDYLFLGHTHRRRDEQVSRTRVINPGALGGVAWQSRSVYLLDLEAAKGAFASVRGG